MPAVVKASLAVNPAPVRINIERTSRAAPTAAQMLSLLGLTSAEVAQLANINANTISATIWGYLAASTAYGGPLLAVASEAAFKALVNLEIGTDVQAYSARLAEIAALAVTDGNIIVGNGSAWVAESGATARTSLGLGSGDSPTFANPTVTSLTATQTTASSPPVIAKNTADNANNRALRIESDRATPANNDVVIAGWYLSDSAGNQDEFARISAQVADVTSGSEDGNFLFGVAVAGTLTNKLGLNGTTLYPIANDGVVLGSVSLGFGDLHGASGFTINIANGDAIVTHVSGGFEVTGTWRSRTPLSSETSGTLTAASANKRVKATAGVTINDGVFTAEDGLEIYNDSDSSITLTQDTGMTLRLAGTTSTGNRTLAARAIAYVYFDTNADAAVGGSGVS